MRLSIWAVLAASVIYTSASLSSASVPGSSTLQIEFSQTPGVTLGTPVLMDGERVGKVVDSGIVSNTLVVEIDNESSFVRAGAMAVLSSAWCSENKQAVSFLEILNPNDSPPLSLQKPQKITGYKGFESFWGNTAKSHWTDSEGNS